MFGFDVSVSRIDEIVTVAARGELDLATAPELQSLIDFALWEQSGARQVVLDLSRLSFCDSSGLQVLMAAHQLSMQNRMMFHIVVVPGPVRNMLELAGVVDGLPIVASRDQIGAAGRGQAEALRDRSSAQGNAL